MTKNLPAISSVAEYHINQSDEDLTDGEDLYDFPLSNRRASDRQGEIMKMFIFQLIAF